MGMGHMSRVSLVDGGMASHQLFVSSPSRFGQRERMTRVLVDKTSQMVCFLVSDLKMQKLT